MIHDSIWLASVNVVWRMPDEGGRLSGPPRAAEYRGVGTFDAPLVVGPDSRDAWPLNAEWLSFAIVRDDVSAGSTKVDFVARDRAARHLRPGAIFYVFEGSRFAATITVSSPAST